MFNRLRAIVFGGKGEITTKASDSSKALTAADMLNAYVNPSGSIASLLIDATAEGAIRYCPVFAAERFICESVAALPLITYRREGGGKERATEHPAYNLLRNKPNEYQTPFWFIQTMLRRAIRKGNAYALIERTGAGVVARLVILNEQHVKIAFEGGNKYYLYDSGELKGTIADSDMIHIMGYSEDGIAGIPLLSYLSNVTKLGIAAEKYGVKFFSQSHVSRGHVEQPPGLSQPQFDQVKDIVADATKGGDESAWKTPVLPYGVKWINDSIPNDSAQFLELRKFQLLEVARAMRVPPHVLQHYENGGTYANIEAQGIDLVVNCLQPWITQVEQQVNAKVFDGAADYFAEFLIDARLRGDTLSRYNAYQIGRQGGWLSVNDIRRAENMSEVAGGDAYLATPVGAAPNATADKPNASEPQAEPTPTADTPVEQTGGANE